MVYGDLDPEMVGRLSRAILGLDSEDVPGTVFIGPYRFERLLGRGVLHRAARSRGFGIERVKTFHHRLGFSFLVQDDDRRALFCMANVGAVYSADTAILLSRIENVEEVIFLGSAACLSDEMDSDDFNLPTKCLRTEKILEGQYPKKLEARADETLRNALADVLGQYATAKGSQVHDGLHATVPYVLIETTDYLRDLRSRGVYTLDMELSVYFTILSSAGKRVAGMIMGGDRPLEGVWMGDKSRERWRADGRCLASTALDYVMERN